MVSLFVMTPERLELTTSTLSRFGSWGFMYIKYFYYVFNEKTTSHELFTNFIIKGSFIVVKWLNLQGISFFIILFAIYTFFGDKEP